jgi:hypothetical protein
VFTFIITNSRLSKEVRGNTKKRNSENSYGNEISSFHIDLLTGYYQEQKSYNSDIINEILLRKRDRRYSCTQEVLFYIVGKFTLTKNLCSEFEHKID